MKRTLEIMEEELRLAEEEKKILDKKVSSIKKEVEEYKLNNGLYHPMSELAKYKGKEISHIVLVERSNDGTLDTEYLYNDDFLQVNDNGYLHYSSYENGIIDYNDNTDKYVWLYYGTRTECDYVGFLEVEFYKD